jgi:hypothetical protein
MPRTCTLCAHLQREEINRCLVAGEGYRNIAERFGTSLAALVRHKTDHIPARLAKAEEAREVAHADTLLDQLLTLSKETAAILKEARTGKIKDNDLALKAIARAERQIELQARLLGELKDTTMVNVLVLPQWQDIRTVILDTLTAHPQARMAVAEALRRLTA